jgi:hypothetical protein
MRFPLLACALIVALAGCTSSSGAAGAPSSGSVAAAPTFGEETGAIAGSVVDESVSPLSGAQVAVKETGASASSDATGRFGFANLAPGTYTLFANKLGYESGARSIEVRAGSAVEVRFVLTPLPTAVPYTDVKTFAGLIECGFGTAVVVGNCLPLQFLFQQLGTNPTATRTVGLYEVSDPEKVKGGVFEMVWKPSTSGSGQSMGLYVDEEGAGPTSGKNYAQKVGPSPVKIEINDEPYKALKPDMKKNKVQTRTFLPGTTPPSYVVNQKFTVFATACYEAMCPPDYTVVKDG